MLYLIGFCVTQTDGKPIIVIIIVTGAGFKNIGLGLDYVSQLTIINNHILFKY